MTNDIEAIQRRHEQIQRQDWEFQTPTLRQFQEDRATLLREVERLQGIIDATMDFDNAPDNAYWTPPHPIFRLSTERDNFMREYHAVAAKLAKVLELLRVAKCPACDGSGAIPHGPDPDGQWQAEQCQWCDERQAIIKEARDEK